MLARAARKARDARMDAVMRVMDVEDLAFPDAAFDCVVSTLVFCSVEDPMRGLNQIRRVLRDGGELRMLEHVRSQRPRMGKVMDMLNPIANLIGDNINRRTVESVQAAGFELLSVEPRHAEILLEIRARRR
jgi:ubiquinone/menaquinone biosynthesis C-methylase UbiE